MFRKNYDEETELQRETRKAREQSRKAIKEAGLAWVDAFRALSVDEPSKKKKKK